MTRVFADPVAVATSGGEPSEFVWQGRARTVRRVLEHWVLTPDWWRDPPADEVRLDYWRVEASAGEGLAVYELRHEPSGGAWTLTAVWD
ncbi:DUF6504 family protein [Actinomadura rayongensis]|uniref:Nucleotidyltransferase n=1 Tax=Actinomadura rayongensis TaxID=1429076 RepID=A0A6I4WDM5_9ACTN|nr:DUF6504 family protein [Actinomadura rayongensis]MXQ65946.1 nucleotidyltransferase [Actinomadura rayongensis]